jgi:hypothetical protein
MVSANSVAMPFFIRLFIFGSTSLLSIVPAGFKSINGIIPDNVAKSQKKVSSVCKKKPDTLVRASRQYIS